MKPPSICNVHYKETKANVIGKPLSNETCYILGEDLLPLPIGTPGELYIGGDGIGRGYLNNQTLTQERFISNPFQNEEEENAGTNTRIYKTGDLALYLPDGNIEFRGRNDFQIKIRGYRVELGEIENKLMSYPDVKQAVVIAREHKDNRGNDNGNQYLVAYYVSMKQPDNRLLLNYLSSQLPEYMLPSKLMHLDKLPLTMNGKIDREALPTDPVEWVVTEQDARNEKEVMVCNFLANVLKLPLSAVGLNTDFFEAGGSSLTATRFVRGLYDQFGLDIKLSDLYILKTVARILEKNTGTDQSDHQQIDYHKIERIDFELSTAQKNMYALCKLSRYPNTFTTPLLIRIVQCNTVLLQRAMEIVIARNRILRMVIRDNTHYDFLAKEHINIVIGQIESEKINDYLAEQPKHAFNLHQGPLIKFEILSIIGTSDALINLTLHHIIAENESLQILITELVSLYSDLKHGVVENKEELLKIVEPDYFNFQYYQKQSLLSDRYKKAFCYLSDKLNSATPIRLDRLSAKFCEGETLKSKFYLNPEVSTSIKKLSLDHCFTFFSVIVGLFHQTLQVYNRGKSNQFPIIVSVSTRPYEFSNVIGPFINALPLVPMYSMESSFFENFKAINKEVLYLNEYSALNASDLFSKSSNIVDKLFLSQIVFVMYNYKHTVKENNCINGVEFEKYDRTFPRIGGLGLVITLVENEDSSLFFEVSYSSTVFSKDYVELIMSRYIKLLEQLNGSTIKRSLFELMSRDEFLVPQQAPKKQGFMSTFICKLEIFFQVVKSHLKRRH